MDEFKYSKFKHSKVFNLSFLNTDKLCVFTNRNIKRCCTADIESEVRHFERRSVVREKFCLFVSTARLSACTEEEHLLVFKLLLSNNAVLLATTVIYKNLNSSEYITV